MPLFRSRPVVVDAEQFTDAANPPRGVCRCTAGRSPTGALVPHCHDMRSRMLPVVLGEWIIAEPAESGFYPCPPEVFARKYEPISEDTPAPGVAVLCVCGHDLDREHSAGGVCLSGWSDGKTGCSCALLAEKPSRLACVPLVLAAFDPQLLERALVATLGIVGVVVGVFVLVARFWALFADDGGDLCICEHPRYQHLDGGRCRHQPRCGRGVACGRFVRMGSIEGLKLSALRWWHLGLPEWIRERYWRVRHWLVVHDFCPVCVWRRSRDKDPYGDGLCRRCADRFDSFDHRCRDCGGTGEESQGQCERCGAEICDFCDSEHRCEDFTAGRCADVRRAP